MPKECMHWSFLHHRFCCTTFSKQFYLQFEEHIYSFCRMSLGSNSIEKDSFQRSVKDQQKILPLPDIDVKAVFILMILKQIECIWDANFSTYFEAMGLVWNIKTKASKIMLICFQNIASYAVKMSLKKALAHVCWVSITLNSSYYTVHLRRGLTPRSVTSKSNHTTF